MIYDLIIIGGGPAGMTASIYASRHKLNHLVLEGGAAGGQIAMASEVENWPGEKHIRGAQLAERIEQHATGLGMQMKFQLATDVVRDEAQGCYTVMCGGEKFSAKTVIFTNGAMHRKLDVPGEENFLGKGVSYCATCDGPFFKGKAVAVIGGGDSALTQSIYLADLADKVYIIHRRSEFRAQEANQDKMRKNPKITAILESEVTEVKGDRVVRSITVSNVTTKQVQELKVDGLFIYVGSVPSSALAQRIGVATDERLYLRVDAKMRTNLPGIFAAGDITGSAPQAIVAAGQGAISAMEAYKFVKGFKDGTTVMNR